MKALKRISEKPNDMVLMDLPEPRLPGDDWLKVKVSYAGSADQISKCSTWIVLSLTAN